MKAVIWFTCKAQQKITGGVKLVCVLEKPFLAASVISGYCTLQSGFQGVMYQNKQLHLSCQHMFFQTTESLESNANESSSQF